MNKETKQHFVKHWVKLVNLKLLFTRESLIWDHWGLGAISEDVIDEFILLAIQIF